MKKILFTMVLSASLMTLVGCFKDKTETKKSAEKESEESQSAEVVTKNDVTDQDTVSNTEISGEKVASLDTDLYKGYENTAGSGDEDGNYI